MLLSADWPRENLLDRSAIAFLADNQSMGQGQQSNTWVSPPGNVYLTLLLQVNIDIISYLPMLCSNQCLAIIRKHAPTIKNRITCKWINDLFINDRKVGGMLIRCSNSGGNIYAEIGIGINIKTSPLADSTCL